MRRYAVVLCNLGGPDQPSAVKPFLFNLFYDPAIIRLPNPFRWLLAKFISSRREKEAQEIYHHLGGKSPILENTTQQASALERILNYTETGKYKTFIVMRYWNPMSPKIVQEISAYRPDAVLFLPLYPQFSTTTTSSSLKDFVRAFRRHHTSLPIHVRCCYPTEKDFIAAHCDLIMNVLGLAEATQKKVRILFSAHGLPEKIVKEGDPYQWQVEETVQAIITQLNIPHLDAQICYQSRVGPLKWIGPSTDDELRRAARDDVAIILVPVAFVSEHSETLVELDIQYKEMLETFGDIPYFRVPTLQTHQRYMESLKQLCLGAVQDTSWQDSADIYTVSSKGNRLCPKAFCGCAMAREGM